MPDVIWRNDWGAQHTEIESLLTHFWCCYYTSPTRPLGWWANVILEGSAQPECVWGEGHGDTADTRTAATRGGEEPPLHALRRDR